MENVRLWCASCGEGDVFPIEIARDAKVYDLKRAIFVSERYNDRYPYLLTPSPLKLYLAKDKSGGWIEENALPSLSLAEISHSFEIMPSALKLDDARFFGSNFEVEGIQIHVLVHILPPPTAVSAVPGQQHCWRLRASIDAASVTKGVRFRLYRLAGSLMGYYDPFAPVIRTRRYGKNALQFENALHNDPYLTGYRFNGEAIQTNVDEVFGLPNRRKLIFIQHYEPGALEPGVKSTYSDSSSAIDAMPNEFKYQLLESEDCFESISEAEYYQLMPHEHGNSYESLRGYDCNKNNQLALSSDMVGWYDGLTVAEPALNFCVVSTISEVKLIIRALDVDYGKLISQRLKDDAIVSDDCLEMRTSVYVDNPKIFCECMEWKYQQIQRLWQDYKTMTSTVN